MLIKLFSNAHEVSKQKDEQFMLYPNGLVVAKVLGTYTREKPKILSYTKHYYAGDQRVSSKIGTATNLGNHFGSVETDLPLTSLDIFNAADERLDAAGDRLDNIYNAFGLNILVEDPPDVALIEADALHDSNLDLEIFYFHPDHLLTKFVIVLSVREPPLSVWAVQIILLILMAMLVSIWNTCHLEKL
jgi:hypothetical protein